MTMTSATSTRALIAFLLARIDDEESNAKRAARQASRSPRTRDPVVDDACSRLLVECDAKRRVIAAAQQLLILRDLPNERVVRDEARNVLHALALPYAAHVGFRAPWAERRAHHA